jgi:uncharacterized protein with PQ loop repeat
LGKGKISKALKEIIKNEKNQEMILADILLSVASIIFTISVVPQILKVIKSESASQLSWLFLFSTSFAILLFIIGKFLVHCYIAAIIDMTGLAGYFALIGLKLYYNGTSSVNSITLKTLGLLH